MQSLLGLLVGSFLWCCNRISFPDLPSPTPTAHCPVPSNGFLPPHQFIALCNICSETPLVQSKRAVSSRLSEKDDVCSSALSQLSSLHKARNEWMNWKNNRLASSCRASSPALTPIFTFTRRPGKVFYFLPTPDPCSEENVEQTCFSLGTCLPTSLLDSLVLTSCARTTIAQHAICQVFDSRLFYLMRTDNSTILPFKTSKM